MKNLIAWASFFAVLAVLSDNLSVFLEEKKLVPKIVAATIVFSFALRFLVVKEKKKGKGTRKGRSSNRRPASQSRTRSSVHSRTDGSGRPSGSYGSDQGQQYF